ncbi:MAG: aspartate/glutamate racemase family protein [Pseudomonadota bacterium]
MPGPILFINPNSDTRVTGSIAEAARFDDRANERLSLEFLTIASAPRTISTDQDVREASDKVCDIVRSRPDAAGFVIACFSDPGLEAAQALTRVPVIGIQRASVAAAIAIAGKFGVIALSDRSIPRHKAEYAKLGVSGHLAAEVGLSDVSALAAGTSEAAFQESLGAGRTLIDRGARSIVLGCAGFSPRRAALQARLGVPVIDPVKAASAMVRSVVG